jgi:hypothetical protein
MELGRVLSLFVAMLALALGRGHELARSGVFDSVFDTDGGRIRLGARPVATRGLRGGVLVVEAGTPSRRLAPSVVTDARALQQLTTEDDRRELRPGELCYALGTLESEQLLSDLPPAVGRIVHTLLTAESRLSQRNARTLWKPLLEFGLGYSPCYLSSSIASSVERTSEKMVA